MKNIIKNSFAVAVAVFSLAMLLPAVGITQSGRAQNSQAAAHQEKQAVPPTNTDKREEAQTRLSNAKLRVCQNREKTITNIMARIGDRAQKQIDLFSKLVSRTEDFYTDKGKILTNYDLLVADVAAKMAEAQAAVDITKSAASDFNCDSPDPKGVAASFKNNLKVQNDTLKAYKTSVKNLIVGVKSVQGSTTSTEKSSTRGDQ